MKDVPESTPLRWSGVVAICATACALRTGAQCHGLWAQAELGSQVGHAMVYDSKRQRLVLHCAGTGNGAAGGTWAWDGGAWTRLAFDGPWPQRTDFAMAYDRARDRVVLFGGKGPAPASQTLGDTWEFDGEHWRLLDLTGTPARREGTLVYDDARSSVLLLGGRPVSGGWLDIWEWDGVRWSMVPASGTPYTGNPRVMSAYDSKRDRLIVLPDPSLLGTTGTWAFAQGQWTRISTWSPHTTYARSMTYDARRDRIVLLSGSWICPGFNDQGEPYTYEFDGNEWSLSWNVPFEQRTFLPITYHGARQTSVIFGGGQSGCMYYPGMLYSETWEWNGTAWSQWADPRPPARGTTAGAYSERLGAAVIFSGAYRRCSGEGCSDTMYRDTWTWGSTGWADASPAVQPSQRKWHAMAYDSRRARVVLYSGEYSGSADTWFFDGAWSPMAAPGPGFLYGHSLAYDPVRDQTVMVVGRFVWELQDQAWIERTPAEGGPPWRWFGALAFDPVRSEMIYFGGDQFPPYRNDTWAWDGQSWTELNLAGPRPPARGGHMMCTDTDRAVVLMSGSVGSPDLGDTWEWNGAAWSQVGADAFLPAPGFSAMVYDTTRRTSYRFALDAFWEWVLPRAPTFVDSPRDTDLFVGHTGTLECTTEQVGPVTLQWRKDGVPLADGGRIRGTRTMRLVFDPAAPADEGCYDVVCTGGCGPVTSEVACVRVFCPADLNRDGVVDTTDSDQFVSAFEDPDPLKQNAADFNGDGFVDGIDYDRFMIAFEAGC